MRRQVYEIKNKKKLVVIAILVALCLLISYLESLLPSIFYFLPYAKIGLSNVVILFTLVSYGLLEGIFVMGFKCLIMGIITGNPFMILYSLAGGLLSVLVEYFLIKLGKNGLMAISSVGGVFHALGQVAMASALTGSSAPFVYMPHLAIFGVVAGLVTGFLTYVLIRYIPEKVVYNSDKKE